MFDVFYWLCDNLLKGLNFLWKMNKNFDILRIYDVGFDVKIVLIIKVVV